MVAIKCPKWLSASEGIRIHTHTRAARNGWEFRDPVEAALHCLHPTLRPLSAPPSREPIYQPAFPPFALTSRMSQQPSTGFRHSQEDFQRRSTAFSGWLFSRTFSRSEKQPGAKREKLHFLYTTPRGLREREREPPGLTPQQNLPFFLPNFPRCIGGVNRRRRRRPDSRRRPRCFCNNATRVAERGNAAGVWQRNLAAASSKRECRNST